MPRNTDDEPEEGLRDPTSDGDKLKATIDRLWHDRVA